tara:strand:+ start:269 stop:1354 length:1086 start_codon:yes stop_codon:yes gene_type:complete
MTKTYIFNQYYIDLIKRLKTTTKKHKEKSTTAKKVNDTIKNNYLTLDKTTDEYILYFKKNISDELYESYKKINIIKNEDKEELNISNETEITNIANEWLEKNSELLIFNDITLGEIKKILRDEYICHHYISIFLILTRDIDDEVSTKIVNLLQQNNYEEELKELEDDNDNFKTILTNLQYIKQIKIKKSVELNMGGMENTTLGQLAKEILEDVDINKLQKSIGENGDVLKSLGDPNSGFGDIISNVSQKMATKLSNGELNQENLMKDAMKFATMMPGMFGNNQEQSKGKAPPNMGNMMSMFADLMSNNNDDMPDINSMKNMAKSMGGNQKGSRSGFSDSNYRKLAAQKKARKKLAAKNNNQ